MKFLTRLSMLGVALSLSCYANIDSAKQLYAENQDYAKCLNVALGNFETDVQDQTAISKLYSAIIANTDKLLELKLQAKDERTLVFLDILNDRKVMLGYMVAIMSEPGKSFEAEKRRLQKIYDYDWRLVHQELWEANGCNTIFGSLN